MIFFFSSTFVAVILTGANEVYYEKKQGEWEETGHEYEGIKRSHFIVKIKRGTETRRIVTRTRVLLQISREILIYCSHKRAGNEWETEKLIFTHCVLVQEQLLLFGNFRIITIDEKNKTRSRAKAGSIPFGDESL